MLRVAPTAALPRRDGIRAPRSPVSPHATERSGRGLGRSFPSAPWPKRSAAPARSPNFSCDRNGGRTGVTQSHAAPHSSARPRPRAPPRSLGAFPAPLTHEPRRRSAPRPVPVGQGHALEELREGRVDAEPPPGAAAPSRRPELVGLAGLLVDRVEVVALLGRVLAVRRRHHEVARVDDLGARGLPPPRPAPPPSSRRSAAVVGVRRVLIGLRAGGQRPRRAQELRRPHEHVGGHGPATAAAASPRPSPPPALRRHRPAPPRTGPRRPAPPAGAGATAPPSRPAPPRSRPGRAPASALRPSGPRPTAPSRCSGVLSRQAPPIGLSLRGRSFRRPRAQPCCRSQREGTATSCPLTHPQRPWAATAALSFPLAPPQAENIVAKESEDTTSLVSQCCSALPPPSLIPSVVLPGHRTRSRGARLPVGRPRAEVQNHFWL